MEATISSWGNSLGLRIPKVFAQMAGISKDQKISLSVEEDKIIIQPKKKKKSLDDLLDGITQDNLHSNAWDDMKPVGREIW